MKTIGLASFASAFVCLVFTLQPQEVFAQQLTLVNQLTSRCVSAKTGHVDGKVTWFTIENRCGETVKVWIDDNGSGRFGSMMELNGGQSQKGWYSNDKVRGIQFFACPAMEGGKEVYSDRATQKCFVR